MSSTFRFLLLELGSVRTEPETSFLSGVSGKREEDAMTEDDVVDGWGSRGVEAAVVVLDMMR